MRERGWTIARLAEACDVSDGLAAKWVSENPRLRVIPSPKSCEKIADALGVDPDEVLELAGHRKAREPRTEVDARRQAVRDQLDRWLTAVGPDNEEYFWQHLKAQGDSAVNLIKRIGTAVNGESEDAVNAAVSQRAERGRKRRKGPNGPLRADQHGTRIPLDPGRHLANQLHAA